MTKSTGTTEKKKSRHKERYTVSKAQRVTVIITTEKLTYSTVLYSTTKGTKRFSKLSVTRMLGMTSGFLDSSHDTLHPCLSFPPVVGPWWHTAQDRAGLQVCTWSCTFIIQHNVTLQKSCFEGGSLITALYAQKRFCCSESVISHRQHIVTHVRANAIRAPTTTMKSRMFHMSRK